MPSVIEKENNTLNVKISGDIDHHTCNEMRHEIDREIMTYRPKCVIFDLTECEFMDSSGLGLILGRFRKTKELGCQFKLVNPGVKTMRILRMAGVDKLITIESIDL